MGRRRSRREDEDRPVSDAHAASDTDDAPLTDALPGDLGSASFDDLAYAPVPESGADVEPDVEGGSPPHDAEADDAIAEPAPGEASAVDDAPGGPDVPDAETATDTPPPRRGFHPFVTTVMMVGFALLAFVTGMVIFNRVVMPRLVHGVNDVKVPDLTGLTLEQAEQTLRPMGLQLSRAGERFDPGVPRGFVLEQDPPPGQFLRGGQRVSVVASLGEEFSSVPNLFGESQRSAEVLLRSAGLNLGVMTRAPSDEVGNGLVAGSDPGAETVLPRGSAVNLLLSTGPGEESFVMPEVLGREVASVRRQLESFGFEVETPNGASVGPIVFQDPAPGSRIVRTAKVTLQASGRVIR
jgi:serine/threonine-protein kinase